MLFRPPALEGGVVKTGMRAAEGAVDTVKIEDGKIQCHVIGEGKPKGICGSGIIDLLAELFLNGWINLFGTLQPERSERSRKTRRRESGALNIVKGCASIRVISPNSFVQSQRPTRWLST